MTSVMSVRPAATRAPAAARGTLALLLDVGSKTGLGHWHRCLALADTLRARWNITLVTPPLAPALQEELISRQQQFCEAADWSPEAVLKAVVGCPHPDVFVLDLIATPVDLVAALREVAPVASVGGAGPGRDSVDLRIDGMIPRLGFSDNFHGGKLLVGPEYVMLRDEFVPDVRPVPDRVENVLVALGGDAEGRGLRLAEQLARTHSNFEFNVVLGPLAEATTSARGVHAHVNPAAVSRLMRDAQVAICSGGMTAYELCRVGVPMILHPQTVLQYEAAGAFAAQDLAVLAVTAVEVSAALNRLTSLSARSALRCQQNALLTERGVVRVADELNSAFLPAA